MSDISSILLKKTLSVKDLQTLLEAEGADHKRLCKYAFMLKQKHLGNVIYLRGLIEFSNICRKNCYYCGLRSNNKHFERYQMTDDEIMQSVHYALDNNYGSLVMQSGELFNDTFTARVKKLIKRIKKETSGKLGITLCCGEQTEETYNDWFESGAHRYLLRIETSNKSLYNRLHPDNKIHSYQNRINCIRYLQKASYQTGTGIMIGLPFQTTEDLANDLMFMKNIDIDMVGMGPYIEQEETPLYKFRDKLLPKKKRLELCLNMIAILRIMMKNINIAATTALDALDENGRLLALKSGANVLMPNITPLKYRKNYLIYDNKPGYTNENYIDRMLDKIKEEGIQTGYGEWGDPVHYFMRKQNNSLWDMNPVKT